MKFQFDSFGEWLWMAGHGPYVWACYGVVFLVLLILAVEPSISRRRFIRQQKALMKRTQAARAEG